MSFRTGQTLTTVHRVLAKEEEEEREKREKKISYERDVAHASIKITNKE